MTLHKTIQYVHEFHTIILKLLKYVTLFRDLIKRDKFIQERYKTKTEQKKKKLWAMCTMVKLNSWTDRRFTHWSSLKLSMITKHLLCVKHVTVTLSLRKAQESFLLENNFEHVILKTRWCCLVGETTLLVEIPPQNLQFASKHLHTKSRIIFYNCRRVKKVWSEFSSLSSVSRRWQIYHHGIFKLLVHVLQLATR